MYQVPAGVPSGMVTAVEPVLLAPGAKAGTSRVPSNTAFASSVLLLERK